MQIVRAALALAVLRGFEPKVRDAIQAFIQRQINTPDRRSAASATAAYTFTFMTVNLNDLIMAAQISEEVALWRSLTEKFVSDQPVALGKFLEGCH
eukprot:14242823-Heterocapsa_arctica.AAC.1